MIKEAEKFKDEDEKLRVKINAKNQCENIICSIKDTIEKKEVKDSLSPEKLSEISDKITETQKWFDNSDNYTTEEYTKKQEELSQLFSSLLQTNGVNPQNMQQSQPTSSSEPTVEEVD